MIRIGRRVYVRACCRGLLLCGSQSGFLLDSSPMPGGFCLVRGNPCGCSSLESYPGSYNKNPANEMEPRMNPACSETPTGRRKPPIRKTVLAIRAVRLDFFQCSNTQRR
jgi:hypothetical protein